MTSLRFLTFTFWNSYVLKLLRLETLTFSDVTLSDINVVWCYVLSQYRCGYHFFNRSPSLLCNYSSFISSSPVSFIAFQSLFSYLLSSSAVFFSSLLFKLQTSFTSFIYYHHPSPFYLLKSPSSFSLTLICICPTSYSFLLRLSYPRILIFSYPASLYLFLFSYSLSKLTYLSPLNMINMSKCLHLIINPQLITIAQTNWRKLHDCLN